MASSLNVIHIQDISEEQLMEVEDDSVPADIPEPGHEPNNIPEPTDEEQNGSLVVVGRLIANSIARLALGRVPINRTCLPSLDLCRAIMKINMTRRQPS